MIPSSIDLSSTASPTRPLSFTHHSHRVCSSFTPSFRLSLRFSTSRRSSACPCAVSSPKVNAMADLLKEASFKEEFAVNNNKRKILESRSRTFLDAKTEEELLGGIRKQAEAGRLPPNVAAAMKELYYNYKNAVFKCGTPMASEVVLSNMSIVFDRVFMDVEDPFVFSPYHEALREPFDYYAFGQNFFRPLIDFGKSYVGNISLFSEVEEKLKEGHNIVLISNHQSEADPAIISLLVEKTNRYIAENLIYVAGDRVITDPLCKPFSMGRNLVCVYSKKHIFDVPELVDMKKKANIRSLKEMTSLFRAGSKIVWIAPSGGRDRPDPQTGEWYPAPFDTSAIDNIRRISEFSGVPGHIYPLALLCYEIMPPPPQVEKEIGESRVISFSGAGLSIGPEINFHERASASENPKEVKVVFTNELYNSVTENYNVLKSAIYDNQGLEASTPAVSLSQPWS